MSAELSVLVIGPRNAGKTLLVRQLKRLACKSFEERLEAELSLTTIPTTGTEIDRVTLPSGLTAKVREVGSCMQLRWSRWVESAVLVLFVVDASDNIGFSSALVGLLDTLAEVREAGKPTLLVLNKIDRCSPEDLSMVTRLLLELLGGLPRLSVVQVSAASEQGMADLVVWVDQSGVAEAAQAAKG